ncbi:hypothetical protein GB883_00005 [Georgenia thermotolerans]|uniref:Uncharacterized protein n=1 Tax=Georgenia thermotolerans TaxID=527326 RepID=A0A7J5UUW0_9MICO|nr:hypothetical protein [Georgenia thermotolerans]KAE8766062.1 hypothetical protein GB883_00005 [Georgenia thermotolerans]
MTAPRWGNPVGDGYAEHLFTVTFEDEVTVATDGGGRVTVPRSFEASWPAGPGVFFRATLDGVRWR